MQLQYTAKNGEEYIFHLIDTPGHVDFTYEVSRSLAACEGAILVVDAAQGIEAQTLANVYLALDNNLEIIPIINKIDLPADRSWKGKNRDWRCNWSSYWWYRSCFSKSWYWYWWNTRTNSWIYPSSIRRCGEPLQALIFDSLYDAYRGVIVSVRIKNGTVKAGDKIKMMATGGVFEVTEVGIHTPSSRAR